MNGTEKQGKRNSFKTAVDSAAGLAVPAGITFIARPDRVFGANDRVRVGVCGIRGQGFEHIKEYSRLEHAEVAAVCDVDENIIAGRLSDMDKMEIGRAHV